MADEFRFVNGAGVEQLDMNDVYGWHLLRGLNMGRAPVNRTTLSQSPYDGAVLASSHLEPVEMTFSLLLGRYTDSSNTLRTADDIIDDVEALRAELNKKSNIIEYKPDGASASFLIDVLRSDMPTLLAGYAINPFLLRGGIVEVSMLRQPNLRSAGAAI